MIRSMRRGFPRTALLRVSLAVLAGGGWLLAASPLSGSAAQPADPCSVEGAAYPIQTGDLTVTGNLEQGGTINISGGTYQPGASVCIEVRSLPQQIGTTTANGAGRIATSVVLPGDLPAGEHEVLAVGAAPGGGTLILSVRFSVGELPTTGSGNTMTIILIGCAALGAGGAILFVNRRRQS